MPGRDRGAAGADGPPCWGSPETPEKSRSCAGASADEPPLSPGSPRKARLVFLPAAEEGAAGSSPSQPPDAGSSAGHRGKRR